MEAPYFARDWSKPVLLACPENILMWCNLIPSAYFSAYGIRPMTIVYEDFVTDFKGTIKDILEYLDIECDDVSNVEMFYKRTSNSHSEKWVPRFRDDLQHKMSDKICDKQELLHYIS